MASGDTLFVLDPLGGTPPATLYATLDTIADTSTPAMPIPVLDYAGATADEHMDWWLTVPSHYAGTTGFTFSCKYAGAGTDGSEVQWEFRVLKLADSDDLSSDLGIDTQTAVTIEDTPIATADDLNVTSTVAMAKATAGTPVAGDRIVIRVSRDYDHAANADDMQLLEVLVTET